jgi:hypothetical protein
VRAQCVRDPDRVDVPRVVGCRDDDEGHGVGAPLRSTAEIGRKVFQARLLSVGAKIGESAVNKMCKYFSCKLTSCTSNA